MGEDGADFVAGICRRLVSGEDGNRVTALAQGIGQSMRRVGHAAALDAADGGQMSGQLCDSHDDKLFRLRRPAKYPRQIP